MTTVRLGRTELVVGKQSFGCLPIQRITKEEAVALLRRAYDGGINYFDTARAYSDSEEKVGAAFAGMRDKIVISTKTAAVAAEGMWKDLEESLRTLRTDYIDIYQFHNPAFCPKPGGEDGLYEAALEAKRQGKIRHISITNHRLAVAHEAIDSGLYDTLQFPFSYLSGPQELELVDKCRAADMGFIAMKALAGGLIRDGLAAAAFMETQPSVVPIWGIQYGWELDKFMACVKNPPEMTAERQAVIDRDRKELSGDFCRGCGYCMPCPAGIEINNCARMSLMLRRAPAEGWLTPEWQEKMEKIQNCLHCGACKAVCPTGAISWKGSQVFLRQDAPKRRVPWRGVAVAGMLALLGVTLWVANQPRQEAAPPVEAVETGYQVGMTAPDFTVPLYGGGEFHLWENRGKVTVLNFWATWCTPCVAELPYFDRLAEEIGDQVNVLAIHSNLVTEDVAAWLEKAGYAHLPMALDESGEILASLGVSTMLPVTVILDAEGKVYYNAVGSVTYEFLLEQVQAIQ